MIPLNLLTVLLSGLSGWVMYFTLSEAENVVQKGCKGLFTTITCLFLLHYAFLLSDDARLLLFLTIQCWYYYHHASEQPRTMIQLFFLPHALLCQGTQSWECVQRAIRGRTAASFTGFHMGARSRGNFFSTQHFRWIMCLFMEN